LAKLQRKLHAHLSSQTAGESHNGNISLAKAAGNVQVDLINTGAGQSHERGHDQNIMDVNADGAVYRRSASERFTGRNFRSGGTEPAGEKLNYIAWHGGNSRIA